MTLRHFLLALTFLAPLPCAAQISGARGTLIPKPPEKPTDEQIAAFTRLFTEKFQDHLKLTGHSLITDTAHQSVLLLHVQPLHDGFFVIHEEQDRPNPFGGTGMQNMTSDGGFTIAKKGTPRAITMITGSLYTPILANVGDTVLIPFYLPAPGARIELSAPAKLSKRMETISRTNDQEIAKMVDLAKDPGDLDKIQLTNQAQPALVVRNATLSSMLHARMGARTDQCSLLLEAREPATLHIEAGSQKQGDPWPPAVSPLAITIVPADKPITILLGQNYETFRGTGDHDFHPQSADPIPTTLQMRPGDSVSWTVWQTVVTYDKNTAPKIAPPPIVLRQRPPASKPSARN